MDSLLLTAAALACPVGMGLMMWMMMRGQHRETGDGRPHADHEVAELRAEVERLKAERVGRETRAGDL